MSEFNLRQLKPKPASQIVPVLNPKYGGQIASRASAPRQLATFIPQIPSPSPAPAPVVNFSAIQHKNNDDEQKNDGAGAIKNDDDKN